MTEPGSQCRRRRTHHPLSPSTADMDHGFESLDSTLTVRGRYFASRPPTPTAKLAWRPARALTPARPARPPLAPLPRPRPADPPLGRGIRFHDALESDLSLCARRAVTRAGSVVILAAGLGKRMKSARPKVLH